MESGTYTPQTLTKLNLTEGYTIALDKRYEAIIISSSVDLINDTIDAYRTLALRLNCLIGIWQQGKYTYIDLVEVRNCTRNEAIRLARAREQLCVWDNANNCELWSTDPFIASYEHNGHRATGYSAISEECALSLAKSSIERKLQVFL